MIILKRRRAQVGDGVGVECDVPETALRFASQLSALEMSLRTGEGADVAAKHAQNMHVRAGAVSSPC